MKRHENSSDRVPLPSGSDTNPALVTFWASRSVTDKELEIFMVKDLADLPSKESTEYSSQSDRRRTN